jgi:hypothetical protein
MINYSNRYKDYSLFLPAVSHCYARLERAGSCKRETPIPRSYLNFLNPQNELFYVPHVLFSAGQAARTPRESKSIEPMFNPNTRQNPTVLGDSGGFQIQGNMIKLNGDETREMILRWLERNCDISMTMDFPTGGIDKGNLTSHIKRFESENVNINQYCSSLGFDPKCYQKKAFAACLHGSIENNNYFIKHRIPKATRFLNVLQGRDESECDTWYNHVKHFEFEGYAMGGPYKENLALTMRRLIHMRDDNQLKDWLHILGIGRLKFGPIYTTIQNTFRQSNPNLVISYDCSNPFMQASKGMCNIGYNLTKQNWALRSCEMKDQKSYFSGDKNQLKMNTVFSDLWQSLNCSGVYVESEISKLLTMGQLCPYNKSHAWDLVSYVLIMNHNLQIQMEAVFAAQDLYASHEVTRIPDGMIILKQLIPEIYKSESPIDMIYSHRNDLNFLANDKSTRGTQTFNEFDMPEINKSIKLKKHIQNYDLNLDLFD